MSEDDGDWRRDTDSFEQIKQIGTPTFGLIVDPLVDFICCSRGVSEVQAPALTLEVGLVGGYEGLLHGEALLGEHGVSNQHRVLVGPSRQGLVQLLEHLVRPCANQVNSCLFQTGLGQTVTRFTVLLVAESSEDLLPGLSVSTR